MQNVFFRRHQLVRNKNFTFEKLKILTTLQVVTSNKFNNQYRM